MLHTTLRQNTVGFRAPISTSGGLGLLAGALIAGLFFAKVGDMETAAKVTAWVFILVGCILFGIAGGTLYQEFRSRERGDSKREACEVCAPCDFGMSTTPEDSDEVKFLKQQYLQCHMEQWDALLAGLSYKSQLYDCWEEVKEVKGGKK